MKLAKRIDITRPLHSGADAATLSATLLVDSKKGTSGWILHIKRKKDDEPIRVEASSSTVLALMMAERNFQGNCTGFYEVDKK